MCVIAFCSVVLFFVSVSVSTLYFVFTFWKVVVVCSPRLFVGGRRDFRVFSFERFLLSPVIVTSDV